MKHRAVSILGVVLLAACDGRFTADLASDPPADPTITAVRASVLGLQLQKSSGGSERLEFRSGEPVDLVGIQAGAPMRLFTSERLSAGQYTGVRLVVEEDADATVVNSVGGEFPVQVEDGAFSAVDFTVEDQQSSSESLTLTLDLRQSLTFNEDAGEYTLTPTIRTAQTGEAAQVTGFVNVTCPASVPLTTAAAVYLFVGADVVPDDLDHAGVEPYATTRLVLGVGVGALTYALRFLPPGDYTVALTCAGEADAPDTDDELEFLATQNVSLDPGEAVQVDLT
jgi:hypothetical protein